MRIRALKSYVYDHRIVRDGDEYEIEESKGAYLVNNGWALVLDKEESIGTQIGLASPAFGHNDVEIKKRGRKKNA